MTPVGHSGDETVVDDVWAPGQLLRAHAQAQLPDQATIDAAVAVALNVGAADAALDADGVIRLHAQRRTKRLSVIGSLAAASVLVVGVGIAVNQLESGDNDSQLIAFTQQTDQTRQESKSGTSLFSTSDNLVAGDPASSGDADAMTTSDPASASSMAAVVVVRSVTDLEFALLGITDGQVAQGWETALLTSDEPVCAGIAYGVFGASSPERIGNISFVVDPDQNDTAVPAFATDLSSEMLAETTTAEVWIQQGVTSETQTRSLAASVLLLRVDSCQEVAVP